MEHLGEYRKREKAFAKAQCIKCHRCGASSETLGPDLTTVAKRFQRKEMLESIVYPSHNISDQYAAQVATSQDRSFLGQVIPRGSLGVTLLLSDGEKLELSQSDIDDIQPSFQSSMPSELLNALSLQQVADLFAYLKQDHSINMAEKDRAPIR
ncbi:MAG TPA: hypothetical protein DHW22_03720 [Planctomycetaceae bacterium]|nr:hypothetical protein [Planctomycetaceae bacterium]|tara:strand:+ start:782 stop:1240 length:459 start_codon:yes stop_codon:yes gene_type:complete